MLSAQEKARLFWHCRRGMLELDLILQRFLEKKVDELSQEELLAFDELLTVTDPELFAWFMGYAEPENKDMKQIVELVRIHS